MGGTLNQLTKPLKSILKKVNLSIIGVMSSFNGTIYDIPTREGGMSHIHKHKKTLLYNYYWRSKEINQVKKNLEEQHFTDPEDKYKFSLVTSTPILQNLNTKVDYRKNIKNLSKAKILNLII